MQTKSEETRLIARLWTGITKASQADAYLQYLRDTGVKSCRATAGNRGVLVLRRIENDHAEFMFVSLWESFDAIRSFAGPTPEKAVYYPEDQAFLEALEPTVDHYELAVAELDDPGELRNVGR
jgi:hypothetical protein